MRTKRGTVADHNQLLSGAGHGYVGSADVGEEAHFAAVVGAYKAQYNDVALLPLERVDGVNGDATLQRLIPFQAFNSCCESLYLRAS